VTRRLSSPPTKAIDFRGDLNEFLHKYKYQPTLTARLDALEMSPFTQELVNEIVLWKNNKFTRLSDELRFRNPSAFQIIDRHAYRAVYGSKFRIYPSTPRKKQIGVYFNYLDELIKICGQKKFRFETIDRVLYQFDKEMNGELPKTED
jgi:hypothetical protein